MKQTQKFIDTESDRFFLSDRSLLMLFVMLVMLFAGLIWVTQSMKHKDQVQKPEEKITALALNLNGVL